MVAAVLENTQANINAKFGIYAVRGQSNSLDRICAVSAVAGTYICSALAPTAETVLVTTPDYPLSTFYADTLFVTKNYGRTITRLDCASENGKGVLVFDTFGANEIVAALISTIPVSAKLSFELAGYDG